MIKTGVGFLSLLLTTTFCLAATPPSDDQIRKDLQNPGVIEIIMRGKGSLERFMEAGAYVDEYFRGVTVRRAGDQPGVTVDVKGDAVYRLIGDHYVFRKMRLAGNAYVGLVNPGTAEINALLGRLNPDVVGFSQAVGEIESLRLAPNPNWEWHKPTSVSFNIVMVYSRVYTGGSYSGQAGEEQPTPRVYKDNAEHVLVDKVEHLGRFRLYRDAEGLPWKNLSQTMFSINTLVKDGNGQSVRPMKLLERRPATMNEVRKIGRATRFPAIDG
jgi:hypothetical protein